MNRLRTVAALAVAGLGVSACSGGTPAAAPSATPRSVSPSAAPSASASPTIVTSGSTTTVRIGPYTQEFEPSASNAAQAQVITSFSESQVLWLQSLFDGQALPLLRHYVVGRAFAAFLKDDRQSTAGGLEPSGRDLLFDIRVAGMSKNEAAVTTCDYLANVTSTYRSTGKLVPGSTQPASQYYQSQTWHLVREPGHWAVSWFSVALLPSAAARQCQVTAH